MSLLHIHRRSLFASLLSCNSIARPGLVIRNTYASLPGQTSLKPHSAIYVSRSSNPYFNLTLEDWLFRKFPVHSPLLLLYRDSPCVVIGRNQNPWKEVNLRTARERGVPWIRRRSGGGTVFHDLGNTNYSIHIPRTAFDRTKTAEVVVRAVRSLGVKAYANDRNDICVGGNKISGSAYKIVSNRAYHHGTMLISTRLDILGDLLRVDKPTMHTKGVASVRSPVCNLVGSNPGLMHEAFVEAVIRSFREEYGVDDEPCIVDETPEYIGDEYFKAGMAELPSWDWAYGQTPEFEYAIERNFGWGDVIATIRSRHGIILSCTFTLSRSPSTMSSLQAVLDELGRRLEGKRYGFVSDAEVFVQSECALTHAAKSEMGELWRWLKLEMSR
ncbi:hypothetical protein SCLCIDRAFT_1222336 [Scleroderma citrinum Foug A]|uniref:Putative lipoate-protein ligase A n=1 Tax=Scleroderma citrinum Foug A TaxID=1036808 RepID=A0A0C2ZN33_9AGAM|nr:hypothetical protein SCLCIDRAFT_1222336 [Scleroderma citrinum Foug A]